MGSAAHILYQITSNILVTQHTNFQRQKREESHITIMESRTFNYPLTLRNGGREGNFNSYKMSPISARGPDCRSHDTLRVTVYLIMLADFLVTAFNIPLVCLLNNSHGSIPKTS